MGDEQALKTGSASGGERSLKGASVLITGAASGIGRAISIAFAEEGAKVFATDIDGAGLASLERPAISVRVVDVSNHEEVQASVDWVVAQAGRLDVLFNNAGIGGRRAIEDLAADEFERMIRIHLFGGYYGLKAALPVMKRQGEGRIVNMLSRGAEAKASGWAAYGSAKAGLFALTRVAAAEVRPHDILVNGMIPGPTRTGMNRGDELQPPEAVVPGARFLATLPAGGPNGRVFWNCKEYRLFDEPDNA